MKLEEVQQAIQKTGFQPEQAQALLSLIDAKTESDMKEVLSEIRNQNVELKRIEDKMDTKFSMIIWVMGVLMALIIALKFLGT